MKKLAVLCLISLFIWGCSAFNTLFHKSVDESEQPLLVNNGDEVADKSYEKATSEGKILAGMTSDMVKKSWGEPVNKMIKSESFIVWEYQTSKLYFLEDVLISWDESK